MLANASIQNTTPLQGLPHCAFRQLAGLRERFVVSPRLDPRFRGMTVVAWSIGRRTQAR
jgi:hypothetical protein